MDQSVYQLLKVHRHIKAPLQEYELPQARFSHVNINIVRPLPPSQGYTHLLTMVDRFTRWPEAIPLSSTETKDIATACVTHWVARFGVPKEITSDRGAQFTSQMWNSVCELLGININRTTAHHAQSNGLVERFHHSMKGSLQTNLDDQIE